MLAIVPGVLAIPSCPKKAQMPTEYKFVPTSGHSDHGKPAVRGTLWNTLQPNSKSDPEMGMALKRCHTICLLCQQVAARSLQKPEKMNTRT